jgi:(2Fe-2S) ferredoxin
MSKHHDLAKGRKTAHKLGFDRTERHILLCCDKGTAKCASRKEMNRSWKYLKRRLKQLGLSKRARVLATPAMCFDICADGPIAVVWPDGVWYGGCRPEVLDRIIDEHLVGGQIVDEYVLARVPACAAAALTE